MVLAAAVVTAMLLVLAWPTAAEREATRWLRDFHRVRLTGVDRLPNWPLSFAGQRVLVRRFTRPESRLARAWESGRRRLPASLRPWMPKLPLARDRVMAIGPALIEIPKMPAFRLALLEAALPPRAGNRVFAIQFAGSDWPVPTGVVPLLERLAEDPDAAVRVQVAQALMGIPPGNPAAERLITRMQADQVSIVREAVRSGYRSDASGDTMPWPISDATSP